MVIVVEATRGLLFDLHSRIGLNLGILIAWWAVNTALFPLACYYMRWKGARDARMAAEVKKQWIAKMETHEPVLSQIKSRFSRKG
jgi:hypothetical protein